MVIPNSSEKKSRTAGILLRLLNILLSIERKIEIVQQLQKQQISPHIT